MRFFMVLFALTIINLPTTAFSKNIKKYSEHYLMTETANSEPGLAISWFGAASVLINDGVTSVLIDPFVSRKENGLLDILLQKHAEVNIDAIKKRVLRPEYSQTEIILVGHSHYDHIMDVPYFAELTDASIFGPPSAKRIVNAHNGFELRDLKLDDLKFKLVYPGEELTLDLTDSEFTVTVFKSGHGNPPLLIDPLSTDVSDDFQVPAPIRDYGLGEVYAYLVEHEYGSILHIGSAGFVPNELDEIKGRVDVVLLSLVGRNNTREYLNNIVGAVRPKYVIPIHYDNLFKPLDKPVEVVPMAKLDEYFSVMNQLYDGVETGIILFDEPWVLPINAQDSK